VVPPIANVLSFSGCLVYLPFLKPPRSLYGGRTTGSLDFWHLFTKGQLRPFLLHSLALAIILLHRSHVNIDRVREIRRDGRTEDWVLLSTRERVRLNKIRLAKLLAMIQAMNRLS
jgi:hypothetical protein